MKIALVGYGRMGKRIEALAKDKGHKVLIKIDSASNSDLDDLKDCDVAIEFTQPNAAISNYRSILDQHIPIVTGTTGWYSHLSEVRNLVSEKKGRFFYASNFSPGVFVAHHLSRELAKVTNQFDYKVEIEEWHHTGKKDAPSGTAQTLAKEIISQHDQYSYFHLAGEQHAENSLPITAHREGEIKGTHTIRFSSEIDTISLKHEAHSRDGFAIGAIMAAEFLITQNPGFYTMNNLIQL